MDNLDKSIMGFLQEVHPQKLCLGTLAMKTGKDSSLVRGRLEKLSEEGLVLVHKAPSGFTYCRLPDTTRTTGRKVRCPRCGRVKKIYRVEQTITDCDNPECKTPSGKRTRFWVRSRTVMKKDVIIYANKADVDDEHGKQ